MKWLKQRRTLLAGLALILVSNAVVLAMAGYNRLGEPDSRVQLTERELRWPAIYGRDKENSGAMLMLRYRVKGMRNASYFGGGNRRAPWLDSDKLMALGFDLGSLQAADSDKRTRYIVWTTRREVILVLEYNGDAYHEAVARLEQQLAEAEEEGKVEGRVEETPLPTAASSYRPLSLREQLDALRTSETRLYIIDAGVDRTALRQRYADGSRYLLMKGTVGLSLNSVDGNKSEWRGVIHSLLPGSVHIPSSFRAQLQPFWDKNNRHRRLEGAPRYAVEFNLGQRLEPWVGGVMALPGGE